MGWSTGNLLSRPWQQINTSLPAWLKSVAACPSIKCIEMTGLLYGHHSHTGNSGWTQDFETYMSFSRNYLFLLWTSITQHIIFYHWETKRKNQHHTQKENNLHLLAQDCSTGSWRVVGAGLVQVYAKKSQLSSAKSQESRFWARDLRTEASLKIMENSSLFGSAMPLKKYSLLSLLFRNYSYSIHEEIFNKKVIIFFFFFFWS